MNEQIFASQGDQIYHAFRCSLYECTSRSLIMHSHKSIFCKPRYTILGGNQGAMLRGNNFLSIQVEASSLLVPTIVISESECKQQTHLEQSHPPASDLSCLEAFIIRKCGRVPPHYASIFTCILCLRKQRLECKRT